MKYKENNFICKVIDCLKNSDQTCNSILLETSYGIQFNCYTGLFLYAYLSNVWKLLRFEILNFFKEKAKTVKAG